MTYWIKVEHTPKGEQTSCSVIDLSIVQFVHVERVAREIVGGYICGKQIQYNFDKDGMKYFMQEWERFCTYVYMAPEAEPSIIAIAQKTPPHPQPGAVRLN